MKQLKRSKLRFARVCQGFGLQGKWIFQKRLKKFELASLPQQHAGLMALVRISTLS
jgi:hypothetical protein